MTNSPKSCLSSLGPVKKSEAALPLHHAWPRCSNRPITEDAYHMLTDDEGLTEILQATHAPVDLTEKAMRP